MRYWLIYILVFFSISELHAQSGVVYGTVRSNYGEPIKGAEIKINPGNYKATSNEFGYYKITLPEGNYNILGEYVRNFVTKNFSIKSGDTILLNLEIAVLISGAVNITKRNPRNREIITGRNLKRVPFDGSVEMLLKTLPGITGRSELSSGYNVRGGNFDENLVYVNGIEIYRPQLVRSGQQEGLSFLNPDLVEGITFSAGGFEAKYGDKLSSVLDVTYKKFKVKYGDSSFDAKNRKTSEGGVRIGLLGLRAYIAGNEGSRFSYLAGFRYRSNSYLLNSLDVQGDYKPVFADFQTLLTYALSSKSEISYLGNVSVNRYYLQPISQTTSFGTVTQALQLSIGFAGSERMLYENTTNALTYSYNPNSNTNLKLFASHYRSSEREYFTVEGAYRLDELDNELGSDRFARAKFNRGFGYFINNGRNELQVSVLNIGHNGSNIINTKKSRGKLEWGINTTAETIKDKLNEWSYQDSSDYSVPYNSGDSLFLNSYTNGKNSIISNRVSAYLQYSTMLDSSLYLIMNAGLRTNYWTFNGQNVISPRVQFTMEPNKKSNYELFYQIQDEELNDTIDSLEIKFNAREKREYQLRASFGYYYQPPFYREMRYLDGNINPELRAQRSIHFVLGTDYYFRAFGRPKKFKLYSELYYKKLDDMVPYQIENVRIRYYAQNSSHGYAAGLDTRVNGEFVPGLESWFSLSFMKTKENITYQENGITKESGYIRRPTDQLMNFSIFFSDELKDYPKFKMNLLLTYGSNIPYYLGGSSRYVEGYKIPAYKRIDIGFSRDIVSENQMNKTKWRKWFQELWVSVDVFNLTQATNTISYIWVKDFQGNGYGVPSYLTSRRLNLSIIAKF